jgi:hypothetical protein
MTERNGHLERQRKQGEPRDWSNSRSEPRHCGAPPHQRSVDAVVVEANYAAFSTPVRLTGWPWRRYVIILHGSASAHVGITTEKQ